MLSQIRDDNNGPVHIVSVGPFGAAVADSLRKVLDNVIETPSGSGGLASPAYWPAARINLLAAWRPVPQLDRLLEEVSYAWKKPFIPAIIENGSLRIGPVLVPGKSACL